MLRRLLTVVLAGLLAISWLAAPAGASWAASSPGSVAAQSTTVAPPTGFTATCVSALLSAGVNTSWTASTSSFVTTYEVRWGPTEAAPTSTKIVSAPTTSTTITIPLGTSVITVRAVRTNWHSVNSAPVSRSVASVLFVGLTCG